MQFREPTVESNSTNRKIMSVVVAGVITGSTLLVMMLIRFGVLNEPEAEIYARVVQTVEEPKPKMQKKSVEKMAKQASTSASSARSTKMIQTTASAVIAMPKVTVVNNGPLGLGEGDFGDGFGSGNGNGLGGAGPGSMRGLGKRIGGMTIEAEKLGVILDTSGSMTKYLEELRKDIKKEFEDAVFREVTGCRLSVSNGNLEELPENVVHCPSVMIAMRELIEIEEVDAVFWFCDLNDGETPEALAELESSLWRGLPRKPVRAEKSEFSGLDALKKMQDRSKVEAAMKKEDKPCRLYIRSVGKRAQKPLMDVVKDSGGSFKRA